MSVQSIIFFWSAYNIQLLELLKLIPEPKLLCMVDTGGEEPCSLEDLISDYVLHLEHHLRQIVKY